MNTSAPRMHTILYQLLHSAHFRKQVRSGETDGLDLTPEELRALSKIDHGELDAMSNKIIAGLLKGDGGLDDSFPYTLGQLADGADRRVVVQQFVESPAYEDYRIVPYSGTGICLEEAFFNFASQQISSSTDVSIARHECLMAVVQQWAANPNPAFDVELEGVKKRGLTLWALVRYNDVEAQAIGNLLKKTISPGFFLYAGGPNGLATGPANQLLAELMAIGSRSVIFSQSAHIANTVNTSPERIRRVATQLGNLGLLV